MTKRNPFAHLSPGYVAEAPDGGPDGTPDAEPLPCRICDGDGEDPKGDDCPRCDGDGTEPAVECPSCDGEGEVSGGTCAACMGEGRTYEDGRPYEGGEEGATAFAAFAAKTMAAVRPGYAPDPTVGMTRKAKRAAINKALGVKAEKSRPRGAKLASKATPTEPGNFAAFAAATMKKVRG